NHGLRNDEREVRRLAALIERRELGDDGPSESSYRGRSRDQNEVGQQMEKVVYFRWHHRDDHVHADLTPFPGDRTAAREHAADHEEEHDLFRPWNGHAEKVPTDDIGEIDRHAGDQKDPRRRAGERKEPTHTLKYSLDHGLTSGPDRCGCF